MRRNGKRVYALEDNSRWRMRNNKLVAWLGCFLLSCYCLGFGVATSLYPGIYFLRQNDTGADYEITFVSNNITQVNVLLSDCIRDIDLEYLFVTSHNRTIGDYSFSATSTNKSVFNPSKDLSTNVVSVTKLSDRYIYNISISLAFERLVGLANLELTYTAKNNTSNTTTAAINIAVAGISFTTLSNEIICGPQKPLILNGSQLVNNNQVVLLATIQYVSGIQASFTSLDNIQLTIFSATNNFVKYSSSCQAPIVQMLSNGSFSVPSSCAMGFTSNGVYFVMEIQKIANGSFGIDLQWTHFDVGDSSEFDTTIYVDIVYHVTPTPTPFTGHTLAEKESVIAGGAIAAVAVGTTVAAFVASLVISKLVTGSSILSGFGSGGGGGAGSIQSTYVERDIYGRGSAFQ
ncbi:hypothetical protein Gasu2_04090 [Galdieria sulphuraria]|uniref:Transmembrane protein n=1 Tax=Galdieria sulphuraria TaxID=130081 RepID=M2W1H0_GALSU|nr:uncharacterized protein Gasu_31490 [Galdieria sulphuraria]EME29511.1 hypothetical protein Gasu_31490 [Galdieria sulphuraria]GJD05967.1 hypothetical protein Gasu2_04090 [Galdieria sulphuraria]|eukprot:XP_005706031.1 hypothetical protein Gasu_31490 [Galdieria sulphuraria]